LCVFFEPVSDRFNQNRSIFGKRDLARLRCRVENGHQVVAVDSDRHHSVAWGARSNSVAVVLVFDRRLKANERDGQLGKDLTEMANPLFLQKKMTGQLRVAAKLKAAWASPSEAEPSPK
jgi:hypothetical protein